VFSERESASTADALTGDRGILQEARHNDLEKGGCPSASNWQLEAAFSKSQVAFDKIE
jgi:hypothetical protein